MENKSHYGIKNAIVLCLIFLGIFVGAFFIFATIIILLKIPTEPVIGKGLLFSLLLSFVLTTFIRYKRSRKKFNFRYWIAFIVFFAGIIFTIFMGGGKLLTYLDIPSIIIIGIVPFLFVSILFGFREMALAFSIQSQKVIDKETLRKAARFFEMYNKTLWVTGAISVIIGVINMLKNLEDKTAIGPNFALALVSLFYCCIIYVLVIMPFMMYIKNQLDG